MVDADSSSGTLIVPRTKSKPWLKGTAENSQEIFSLVATMPVVFHSSSQSFFDSSKGSERDEGVPGREARVFLNLKLNPKLHVSPTSEVFLIFYLSRVDTQSYISFRRTT